MVPIGSRFGLPSAALGQRMSIVQANIPRRWIHENQHCRQSDRIGPGLTSSIGARRHLCLRRILDSLFF